MPSLRALVSGTSVAPTTTLTAATKKSQSDDEKPQSPLSTTTTVPTRKPPILLHYRSHDNFIFATAAVGLFTSTFVHSVLFPLSPFIVNHINHGDDLSFEDTSLSNTSQAMISRETGVMVALYAVGLLVGSPIFGWLGDRIRQRRLPMLLGIMASIAANIMFMFACAYWMLLLARFLQGVSNACVWTMSLCLIADNWPERHLGLQMGKLVGFYPLGIVAGLPVGVLYARLGYQAPFAASMILCGIDFFMRLVIVERCHSPKEWFVRPADPEQPPSQPRKSSDSTTTAQPEKVTLKQLLTRPRLLTSLYITFVVAGTMSCFESTLSMRLATEWHFDEAAVGLIFLAYMVPFIGSSTLTGWFCDKYGAKVVVISSTLLLIPVTVSLGIPDSHVTYWTIIAILILSGTVMAGCQAPVFPEIAAVVSQQNGNSDGKDGLATSYALFNAAYGVGMCVGPILAGYLYSSVGFFWLCFVIAMLYVTCLPLTYFFTGQPGKFIVRRLPSEKVIDDLARNSASR